MASPRKIEPPSGWHRDANGQLVADKDSPVLWNEINGAKIDKLIELLLLKGVITREDLDE